MTVLIIGNYTRNLRCFRRQLIEHLLLQRHRVVTMAPDADGWTECWLADIGVTHYRLRHMQRSAMNPFGDAALIAELVRLIDLVAPDRLVLFTHKPNIYGTLAARCRLKPVPAIALVEGLGFAFISSDGLARRASKVFFRLSYRLIVNLGTRVCFLNRDDAADLFADQLPAVLRRLGRFPGVGVDLQRFTPRTRPKAHALCVCTVARLLRSKGLREYIEAATALRARYPGVRFLIVGATDPGPDGLAQAEIDIATKSGVVEYLGSVDDIENTYAMTDVFVLASYREGLPVTIMEAMASGVAVVCTDVPGCRELVEHGKSGLLVKPRNSEDLAGAIDRLLSDRSLRLALAAEGRRQAQAKFDALNNASILAAILIAQREDGFAII